MVLVNIACTLFQGPTATPQTLHARSFLADFKLNLRFAAETGETCVNESQLCLGLRLHTRGFPQTLNRNGCSNQNMRMLSGRLRHHQEAIARTASWFWPLVDPPRLVLWLLALFMVPTIALPGALTSSPNLGCLQPYIVRPHDPLSETQRAQYPFNCGIYLKLWGP